MKLRHLSIIALSALVLATASGCAVVRGQSTVGAFVDDTAITLAVRARFVESEAVNAGAIGVETLNGTVMLSGFATSRAERVAAEGLAWRVAGVQQVKNQIVVRP